MLLDVTHATRRDACDRIAPKSPSAPALTRGDCDVMDRSLHAMPAFVASSIIFIAAAQQSRGFAGTRSATTPRRCLAPIGIPSPTKPLWHPRPAGTTAAAVSHPDMVAKGCDIVRRNGARHSIVNGFRRTALSGVCADRRWPSLDRRRVNRPYRGAALAAKEIAGRGLKVTNPTAPVSCWVPAPIPTFWP